jgi:hypothetical protein
MLRYKATGTFFSQYGQDLVSADPLKAQDCSWGSVRLGFAAANTPDVRQAILCIKLRKAWN